MTYDYNEHIFRLQEQRDSVARELEAMREDQNYRFREMERRTNAEASELKAKNDKTPRICDPDISQAYEQIGIQAGEKAKNKKDSLVADILFLLFIITIIVASITISAFAR